MLLRPFDIYLKWALAITILGNKVSGNTILGNQVSGNTVLGNTVLTIKTFSTIKTLIRAFWQFLQCLCKGRR